ncbi:MAG TPA: NUDIX hydrolase [Patescibacteria group bacterium]
MKRPTQKANWEGEKFVIEWIKTNSVKGLSPITQVYGVCFNDKNEILIARKEGMGEWIIPGGHPEKDETIEETLKREMIEEADIKVKNIKVVGVQKVNPKDAPEKYYYQVRCVCLVDELLPQTPDPDNGKNWERKFVPSNQVTKHVKWGEIGEAMFKAAITSNKRQDK